MRLAAHVLEFPRWTPSNVKLLLPPRQRLCEPSSELHPAEHFYEASALAELLGVRAEKVNEDRFYRALDQLLPHKEAVEMT